MRKFNLLLFGLLTILAAGCSGGEPNPDNGGNVKPDETVPDPTGTVTLSMRNNDGTSLDGLYIGDDDNFHGHLWMIANYGKVKGLGNVSTIPAAGWADKVSVQPGCGYVAYNGYTDEYIRIYVVDYMEGATTGGIIGAEIKYQKPFRGLDETISLDSDQVVLPAEGGAGQVVFKNTSIIPFKVTSSEEWCRVQRASTRDESFLYDALQVSCDESFAAEEQTAVVTIETLFGRTTELTVKRAPRGEFITMSTNEIDIPYLSAQTKTYSVNIYTNIEPGDIDVESDSGWLSASFSGRSGSPLRRVRSVEGQPLTRATLENPVNKEMIITVDGYMGVGDRAGHVTLSYNDVKAVMTVTQKGSEFSLSKHTFTFEGGEDMQSETVSFSGSFDYRALMAQPSDPADTWVSVSFEYWQDMKVTVQPNPFEKERTAKVKIFCTGYGEPIEVDEITVIQKGTPAYDREIFFPSSASNYTVYFPLKEGAKITSSADWCTATANGTSLVVRATATEENRSAVITVDGVSSKIYVSQSKYKVGDTYDEDGVTGQVYSMDNGLGRIIEVTSGKYAWSTESVDIQGAYSSEDGQANTAAIHAIPGWQELYPAFAAVEELNTGGVTGWYMPARKEYTTFTGYWSSTQRDTKDAYPTGTGDSYHYPKSYEFGVIAMHRFSYDFNNK